MIQINGVALGNMQISNIAIRDGRIFVDGKEFNPNDEKGVKYADAFILLQNPHATASVHVPADIPALVGIAAIDISPYIPRHMDAPSAAYASDVARDEGRR